MKSLRSLIYGAALLLSIPGLALAQAPPGAAPLAGTTIRGTVISVAPTNDFFIVQTTDGRRITLYPNLQTIFRSGERPIQFRDVRPEAAVTVVYNTQARRNVPQTVSLIDAVIPAPPATPAPLTPAPPAPAPPAPPPAPPGNGTTIEGTIVKVQGTDQFIVRTADGREMVLYSGPQTVYKLDNRAIQIADLQQGMTVAVTYDLRGRRPIVRTVIGVRRVP